MKLLFDHNLSPKLARRLDDLYPGSTHTHTLHMGEEPDEEVWRYARQQGYTLVTKDADFADLSTRFGPPPKVVWVRLGNCTTQAVEEVLRQHRVALAAFGAEPTLGLLILR